MHMESGSIPFLTDNGDLWVPSYVDSGRLSFESLNAEAQFCLALQVLWLNKSYLVVSIAIKCSRNG